MKTRIKDITSRYVFWKLRAADDKTGMAVARAYKLKQDLDCFYAHAARTNIKLITYMKNIEKKLIKIYEGGGFMHPLHACDF